MIAKKLALERRAFRVHVLWIRFRCSGCIVALRNKKTLRCSAGRSSINGDSGHHGTPTERT